MRAYAEDYVGWVEDTAEAIESGRFHEIDRAALADEVRDLGLSERRALQSALRVLLTHLLKKQYQPERATSSWSATILVQAKHIRKAVEQSPSLKPKLRELALDAYEEARIDAANETGLPLEVFPEQADWTMLDAVLQ